MLHDQELGLQLVSDTYIVNNLIEELMEKKYHITHFFYDTPIFPNTLLISFPCPGIFFSLPTQEFFRGQGKIKVGTETEKMIKAKVRFNFETNKKIHKKLRKNCDNCDRDKNGNENTHEIMFIPSLQIKGMEKDCHAGNTAKDTQGCILLGENRKVGMVLNSRSCLKRFIQLFVEARDRDEAVYINFC